MNGLSCVLEARIDGGGEERSGRGVVDWILGSSNCPSFFLVSLNVEITDRELRYRDRGADDAIEGLTMDHGYEG